MLNPPYPEIEIQIEELRKELLAEDKQRQAPFPDSFFHYTNAAGLLGILSSSRLWATHALYLNDRREIDHAASLVIDVIEERKKVAATKAVATFLDKAISNFNLYDAEDEFYDAYVVSFCDHPDLLSQWRGYGGAGGGFAVGIRPNDTKGNPVFAQGGGCLIMLMKVEYEESVQASIISTTIDRILTLVERALPPVEPKDIDRAISRFTMFLQQELAIHLLTFKDPAFAEEKEWRLIALADFQFPHFRDDLKFRAANNLLIPYYELNVSPLLADEQGRLSINAIVIGPTLEEGLTTKSIAMAVTKYGYDLPNMNIRQSIVPLRF